MAEIRLKWEVSFSFKYRVRDVDCPKFGDIHKRLVEGPKSPINDISKNAQASNKIYPLTKTEDNETTLEEDLILGYELQKVFQ